MRGYMGLSAIAGTEYFNSGASKTTEEIYGVKFPCTCASQVLKTLATVLKSYLPTVMSYVLLLTVPSHDV